jgi:hypothetical protein
MRRSALLSVLAVAGAGISTSAATIDFQEGLKPTTAFTSSDSSLRAKAPTSNYGSTSYLYLGGISQEPARMVLSFNLKAAGGLSDGDTISSVKLTITRQSSSGTGWDSGTDSLKTMTIQRLTTPFTESGVTWNDSAESTPWATTGGGGDFSATTLSSVVEGAANNGTDTFTSTTDFAAAAQDALDHNNGILNLIIRAPNAESTSNYVQFWSHRTGTKSYHPLLEVTTAVPEPATTGLLVIGGVGALAARRRK